MTDPRLTPANGRVAAAGLKGHVEAASFVEGEARSILAVVTDLMSAPDGTRVRQVQHGQSVRVYEDRNGWAFLQSDDDGYVGYARAEDLGEALDATHRVATPATHAYEASDMKSRDLLRLGFGAKLRVEAEGRTFWETDCGYVPKTHLRPLDRPFSDPATVAQLHFGVPYLWGGNSTLGLDCSGLVQAALLACGQACPGDSDLQEAALGRTVSGEPAQRGDLYFWAGHVAMAVDDTTLIHANAHHMAVAYEPIETAIRRIEAQGDGPVTSHRRL